MSLRPLRNMTTRQQQKSEPDKLSQIVKRCSARKCQIKIITSLIKLLVFEWIFCHISSERVALDGGYNERMISNCRCHFCCEWERDCQWRQKMPMSNGVHWLTWFDGWMWVRARHKSPPNHVKWPRAKKKWKSPTNANVWKRCIANSWCCVRYKSHDNNKRLALFWWVVVNLPSKIRMAVTAYFACKMRPSHNYYACLFTNRSEIVDSGISCAVRAVQLRGPSSKINQLLLPKRLIICR